MQLLDSCGATVVWHYANAKRSVHVRSAHESHQAVRRNPTKLFTFLWNEPECFSLTFARFKQTTVAGLVVPEGERSALTKHWWRKSCSRDWLRRSMLNNRIKNRQNNCKSQLERQSDMRHRIPQATGEFSVAQDVSCTIGATVVIQRGLGCRFPQLWEMHGAQHGWCSQHVVFSVLSAVV